MLRLNAQFFGGMMICIGLAGLLVGSLSFRQINLNQAYGDKMAETVKSPWIGCGA